MEAAEFKVNLDAMRHTDIRTVHKDMLVDIQDVRIDTSLPKRERIEDFIQQIKNPYCYRHGDYIVKVSFTDTETTLEDRLINYIRSK